MLEGLGKGKGQDKGIISLDLTEDDVNQFNA